jgi:hypothetical protein
MHVDRALSKRIAQRIKVEKEQCYHAACFALLDCSELSIGRYVEGYTVDESGLIAGHGWIELGNRIIDPTVYEDLLSGAALQQEPGLPGHGHHPKARVRARGPADLLPVRVGRL